MTVYFNIPLMNCQIWYDIKLPNLLTKYAIYK